MDDWPLYHHITGEWSPGESETFLNPVFPVVGQVKALLEEILERVTDEFNMAELMAKVEERTPYIVVAFQECERMNILTREIQRSLRELDLGLKVSCVRSGWEAALPEDTAGPPGGGGLPGTWELGSCPTAIWMLQKVSLPETRVWLGCGEAKTQGSIKSEAVLKLEYARMAGQHMHTA